MTVSKPIAIGAAVAIAALIYLIFGSGDPNGIPEGIAYGNGRIEAVQVDVTTRIAGRVEEISAKEGDLVQPGERVAVIDTAQLEAQLLRAKAEVANAESQVAAAQASIAQANAQLILAERELKRTKSLVDKAIASQETYDTRLSNRDVAKANLAVAEATLVSRQRGVEAARAVVQEIQTQIDDATLRAPVLGRVLYRLAEPGEVLSAGGKVLTLVNLTDVYMEIYLPAAEAHRVSIGGDARIKLDIVDFAVPAKVSFVSPESQFTPKQVETQSEREKLMFRVKVRVPSELILRHIDRVKTGIRGVAYVRLSNPGSAPPPEWPEFLQKLPPGAAETVSKK
ncbi:MAG: HlyD family efflux transporter periplasmic adaptor subunit [Alphaproteobacteria bacterium]|nr:HlyD family efflux transporter periplasmic adaptor subunit [Alphaproteobacteria bacterium]